MSLAFSYQKFLAAQDRPPAARSSNYDPLEERLQFMYPPGPSLALDIIQSNADSDEAWRSHRATLETLDRRLGFNWWQ